MTTKNEAAAPKAAPRSHARQVLAARIAERDRASAASQKIQDAITKLGEAGQEASRLAAQLAAASAADAQAMRDWAATGAEGEAPTLTDGRRAEAKEALAEAEAKAAAAVTSARLMEGELIQSFGAVRAAASAAQECVPPIVAEELAHVVAETEALTAKLIPLHERIASAREWAYGQVAQGGGSFGTVAEQAGEAMRRLRVPPETRTHQVGVWSGLADRLLGSADAEI